jgi:chromosome segregation ATPase
LSRKGSARNSQTVALLQELDAAKNRNAWYASELELARKAGYTPNPSSNPVLDQRAAESFDDDDKPLIEALIAMKTELTNVQASIDKQAIIAAKKIAEVEKQRDAAVSEAVYAKARFAAQGGSQASTPQPDSEGRDIGAMSSERSTDISRKLAASLAEQRQLKNRLEILNSELESERRVRQLAEDSSSAHQSRMTQLEAYKQQNASEVERLKAELHEFQSKAREDGIVLAGAVAAAELVRAEKDSLEKKYNEVMGSSRDHSDTFESLREAVASSADMRNLLERKLDEERLEREKLQNKLIKLKSEHENSTAELETMTRRLRDAEELAEQHAQEAKTHRQAVLSGLDKVSTRDVNPRDSVGGDRTLALQNQIQAANSLVRKYQSAADSASEKLRSAEERIAGLEAYQEQASRESMSIRKQLQGTMREIQTLQAKNSDMKHQLANQQLETNAVHVQHNTLKDILGERGMSPVSALRSRGLSSPQSGANTPDQSRMRELEQQVLTSTQANAELRQKFETREQEAESAYREKLTQLENDYQSAVHYVKGTEKMLKRMKDELTKYKTDNTRMKAQLEDAESTSKAPSNWEEERSGLTKKIDILQTEIKTSAAQLERQMADVKQELAKTKADRDNLAKASEQSQQKARADLAQLQQENAQLERRAQDAEQKVSLLLDQVESSVDNYRRQSRNAELNSQPNPHIHTHQRNLSAADSEASSSVYGASDNRNSMALDSLASELETLRSHWETTNKNYRLSKEFEFDDRAAKSEAGEGLGLSGSLADWRKRLDEEEEQARKGKDGSNTLGVPGGLSSPTKREMSPSGKEVGAAGMDKNQVNII